MASPRGCRRCLVGSAMARSPTVVSRGPKHGLHRLLLKPGMSDSYVAVVLHSAGAQTDSVASQVQESSLAAGDPLECWRLAASRSVTHPTRLETRTKESNMCASQWVSNKPRGAMKAKAGLDSGCVGIPPPSSGGRTNDPSFPIHRLGGV